MRDLFRLPRCLQAGTAWDGNQVAAGARPHGHRGDQPSGVAADEQLRNVPPNVPYGVWSAAAQQFQADGANGVGVNSCVLQQPLHIGQRSVEFFHSGFAYPFSFILFGCMLDV
ncbi:hypothetical protein ACFQX6_10830 [Streptosporangium lutulentum]